MVKNYFRLTLVYMVSGKHRNPQTILYPDFGYEKPR